MIRFGERRRGCSGSGGDDGDGGEARRERAAHAIDRRLHLRQQFIELTRRKAGRATSAGASNPFQNTASRPAGHALVDSATAGIDFATFYSSTDSQRAAVRPALAATVDDMIARTDVALRQGAQIAVWEEDSISHCPFATRRPDRHHDAGSPSGQQSLSRSAKPPFLTPI
jgi:hypothetical protein